MRTCIAALILAAMVAPPVQAQTAQQTGTGHIDTSPALEIEQADGETAPNMVLIPGGTFRMGTDNHELAAIVEATGLSSARSLSAEVPGHEVTVKDFWLDSRLVTNAEFSRFVRSEPQWSRANAAPSLHNGRFLEHWNADETVPSALAAHPATFVSWQSAAAYCAWRGGRLPSEAEFEWAASGVDRTEYPWGNSPPTAADVNWSGDGIDTTVPTGSYPPNPRGLYDMAGNVWQFTADPWRGSYAEMAAGASEGDMDDTRIRRVVRGGSYGANAANLRVRYRDSHRPFDAREMVGFRCARD